MIIATTKAVKKNIEPIKQGVVNGFVINCPEQPIIGLLPDCKNLMN
jgi:hypothetical protein